MPPDSSIKSQYSGPDAGRIREMFRSISGQYDRANTVLSAGIHHRWRTATVCWSQAKPGERVLDCATGTGDLAIAFRKAVGSKGEVIGTDFVPEMLEVARRKTNDVHFETADVMALPYPDDRFDIASIAFGIRNVSDPKRGLFELARVVRPGGRVMILEFGQPENPIVSRIYGWYRSHVLPRIGGLLTGKREAYEYLERSSAAFPCGARFVELMQSTGAFSEISFRPLSFGIAYIYRGVRL